MIVFAACAVLLTLTSNESLVAVGLAAYGAIGMLAPGVFFGFLWPRTSALAIAAPIPPEAPVTSAVMPERSNMCLSSPKATPPAPRYQPC